MAFESNFECALSRRLEMPPPPPPPEGNRSAVREAISGAETVSVRTAADPLHTSRSPGQSKTNFSRTTRCDCAPLWTLLPGRNRI